MRAIGLSTLFSPAFVMRASFIGAAGTFAELGSVAIDHQKHPILRKICEVFARVIQGVAAAFPLIWLGLNTSNPNGLIAAITVSSIMILTPIIGGFFRHSYPSLEKIIGIFDQCVNISIKAVNTVTFLIATIDLATRYDLNSKFKETLIKIAFMASAGFAFLNYHAYEVNSINSCNVFRNCLTFAQFKGAYNKLGESEKRYMNLRELSKERISYIFDQNNDRINDLNHVEIEFLAPKIEPRFFKNLTNVNFDLSKLDGEQLFVLLQRKSHFYDTTLKDVNLASLTKAQITLILEKNPEILEKLSSTTVIDNLSKIETRFYNKLSVEQLKKINFSAYSAEQFTHLLDQNPEILEKLSPNTVMDNLSKIETRFYNKLSSKKLNRIGFSIYSESQFLDFTKQLTPLQISSFDLKKLTVKQILVLLKNYSSSILHGQMSKIDLDYFTKAEVSEIIQFSSINLLSPQTVAENLSKFEPSNLTKLSLLHIHALNFSKLTISQLINLPSFWITSKIMEPVNLTKYSTDSINGLFEIKLEIAQKLSSHTIAANLSRIQTKYYQHLHVDQLKDIDYQELTDDQKKAFLPSQLIQMKNYPNPHSHGNWDQNNFFNAFLNQIPESYTNEVDCAIEQIKKTNKVNLNPAYEKLRQKFLKKGKALKKNPKLIYVDNEKDFDQTKLKSYHNKAVLLIHPDKNPDNIEEATALFRAETEAYEYLK